MFRGALERFVATDEKLVRDVADSKRLFWLGSGISRDQVPDLAMIMRVMLLELRDRARSGAEADIHRDALTEILSAHLQGELPRYKANPETWEPVSTEPLRNVYSDVIGTRVGNKPGEYLLLELAHLIETYGDSDLRPGPIHQYLAILIAEGMVTNLASGNWDGLVEAALRDLTATPEWLDVYVTGDDRRNEKGFARLAKFHGCAVLAREHPNTYLDRIIATRAQISRFSTRAEFEHMRTWLSQRTEQDRSIILGLSVQDSDLLNVFTKAAEAHPWQWDSDRPAYVFAQPTLRDGQLDVLDNCYNGDFNAHREAVIERSAFGHYAGPTIAALTWRALALKALAMLERADLSSEELADGLSRGLNHLAEEVPRRVGYDEGRLLEFLLGPYSDLVRDYFGGRNFPGRYAVALRGSLSHVATDPTVRLLTSDLLACAIGFLGWGLLSDHWKLAVHDSSGHPRLGLARAASSTVIVRIVRGAVEADEVLSSADWTAGEGDVALIYMHDRPRSSQRSTSSRMGSRRRTSNRMEISWRDLTSDAISINEASSRFLSVVGI